MSEVMIASPRIIKFLHAMRPFNIAVPMYTKDGRNAGKQLQPQPKQLTMGVKYSAGDIEILKESYTFPAEESEGSLTSVDKLFEAAGIAPEPVWAKALDVIREVFPVLADPAPGAEAVGIQVYPRIDVVDASLDKATTMSIVFLIGVYTDPGYADDSLKNVIQVEFQGIKTFEYRTVQLAQYNQTITRLDELIAGTHPNQAEMDKVALAESKVQAASDKRIVQAQIVQHEKALVGKMQDVLAIPEVQAAFAAVTEATFTELKAKKPEAAAWDIPTLMSFFPAAMAEVAGA
jgi:hypothetical protein